MKPSVPTTCWQNGLTKGFTVLSKLLHGFSGQACLNLSFKSDFSLIALAQSVEVAVSVAQEMSKSFKPA